MEMKFLDYLSSLVKQFMDCKEEFNCMEKGLIFILNFVSIKYLDTW